MKIVDFTPGQLEQAALLARLNYDEERFFVPALPELARLPALDGYAGEKRGVAALGGGELLGFFCWNEPQEGLFGPCKGAWSPVHAHGAVSRNRAEIYERLYQAAAERLVSGRVFSHAVTLYAHDEAALKGFFQGGFGGRCVDAVRETLPLAAPPCQGIRFRRAESGDAEALARMRNRVSAHLSASPIFLPFSSPAAVAGTADEIQGGQHPYFIALDGSRPVAFLRLQADGENFAANDPSMMNISGAYTEPELRGKGIATGLLAFMMDELRGHGIPRCGVDFESFNPEGRRFWLKHFTAYTTSVARRVDERILN
ncbi:MAG: GNAT family N-acetyltransferase [Christensenellaceae bacterium]|jgi:GNAT superfamily N-acetyltransferase|nr:GNAT family N-acetyltransferase [Christensenellaceae bacterium]